LSRPRSESPVGTFFSFSLNFRFRSRHNPPMSPFSSRAVPPLLALSHVPFRYGCPLALSVWIQVKLLSPRCRACQPFPFFLSPFQEDKAATLFAPPGLTGSLVPNEGKWRSAAHLFQCIVSPIFFFGTRLMAYPLSRRVSPLRVRMSKLPQASSASPRQSPFQGLSPFQVSSRSNRS